MCIHKHISEHYKLELTVILLIKDTFFKIMTNHYFHMLIIDTMVFF